MPSPTPEQIVAMVSCPTCKATKGKPCTYVPTKNPDHKARVGKPLPRKVHPDRTTDYYLKIVNKEHYRQSHRCLQIFQAERRWDDDENAKLKLWLQMHASVLINGRVTP